MTTTGTHHFVDMAAALAYYCGVRKTFKRGPLKGRTIVRGGLGYKPEDVHEMLAAGDIALGTPKIPAGAVLSVIKDEGRYQYTTQDRIAA